VSVHLALAPDTRQLCDAGFFAAMKKGACFINTARGEIVDEEALKAAIRDKGIRAGLDVFAEEPAGGTGEFTSWVAQSPASTALTTSARPPKRRRRPLRRRPYGLCAYSRRPASRRMS